MQAPLLVLGGWLLFAATHLGLATRPVRPALIARLGEAAFRLLFFIVASLTFPLLVYAYAVHHTDGPAGLGPLLGAGIRQGLWVLAALGATLLVAGLVAYQDSPMELSRTDVPRPGRLARITRHPFFVGLALLSTAHALLAAHATGLVFFAGFVPFSLGGAWLQDRKLLAARGAAYAEYCRQAPFIPTGSWRSEHGWPRWRDVPVIPLGIGALGATLLRWSHPALLAHDGAWISGSVVGGAAALGVLSAVRNAWQRGQGAALATAGGVLVMQVGLAHEFVGAQLYPDGPALFGGPIGWHLVGLSGVVAGLLMTATALGFIRAPLRFIATSLITAGIVLLLADTLLHGGFHFFACMLVVGSSMALLAPHPDGQRVPSASER